MTFVEPPDGPYAEAVRLLGRQGLTIAAAESLTAGLFTAHLSEVPGASDVLLGGVTAYAREVKARLFEVDPDHVVCTSAAQAMADGVREVLGADVGISLTGVAGPTTQDGHRVGTVFLALSAPRRTTKTTQLWLPGDPTEVREAAAEAAAALLVELLEQEPLGDGATASDGATGGGAVGSARPDGEGPSVGV